jgi:ariadne-1
VHRPCACLVHLLRSISQSATSLSTESPPNSATVVPPLKRKAPASPVSEDLAPCPKKLAMASDASDEDIFDYDDDGSIMDYDDGDSSIEDGMSLLGLADVDDMDQDLGLSLVLEEKNARKAHEVEFQPHSISDIRQTQETQIANVASVCFIDPTQAAILLRYHRWNKEKAIEAYMDDPDRTLKKAGIVNDDSGEHRIQRVRGFECEICFDDDNSRESYALQCGHRACSVCWGTYLTKKIKEDGESSKVQCLFDKCNVVVDETTVELLVEREIYERYVLEELLT